MNNVGQTSIAAVADNDMDVALTGDKTVEQRTAQSIRRAQKRAADELTAEGGTQTNLFGTAAKKETGAVEAQNFDVGAEQKGVINAVAAAGGLSKSEEKRNAAAQGGASPGGTAQGGSAGGAQEGAAVDRLKELLGTKLDDVKTKVGDLFTSADQDLKTAKDDREAQGGGSAKAQGR